MSMKIVVTGCAGFMGSWLTEALVKAGHLVWGLDDFSGGCAENVLPGIDFDRIDLSDYEATKQVLSIARPDVLFYLAANAREGASQFQPQEVTRRNVWAYVNTLESAIAYGVKRVIFFSSMARYGDQETPFHEGMSTHPVDVYGVNKVACEQITKILADVHEFQWNIIVPHNVFGSRQNLSDPYRNVAAIFMNRIMRHEPIYIYGDGNQQRAFSYIEDSLPCYLRCLDEDIVGETINIGGATPITVNELAQIVIQEFPEYPTPEIIYLPDRPREVKYAFCTTQRSEERLGYRERTGWREGLHRMAQWAKERGPQEWTRDSLPLLNDKAPITWRSLEASTV